MAAHRFWWAAICVVAVCIAAICAFGSRLRARADGGSGDDAGAGSAWAEGLPRAVAGMLLRVLGARLRPGASATAWCVGYGLVRRRELGLGWGPGLCWGLGGAVVVNYSL